MNEIILVAGASGNLGQRIVKALLKKNAVVYAMVRHTTNAEKVKVLENLGVKVLRVDMANLEEISNSCIGVSCVVSALSGLKEVIIDTQKRLLDAAVNAGVPRFIPSDFSLDFTQLKPGQNRNLDLRRDFHTYLDNASISATTIFNGPFMDLLTGPMPLILFKQKRILYWGKKDTSMDFTTMDDTAEFTANAALDPSTPRFLKIAGDRVTARQLCEIMEEVTGEKFSLLRAGGIWLLNGIIKIAKTIAPAKDNLYPVWQGMQYMRDMMEGKAKIDSYDNNRYAGPHWTSIKEFLASHQKSKK